MEKKNLLKFEGEITFDPIKTFLTKCTEAWTHERVAKRQGRG